ncbi:class I fructose-bisphosphate aldolase [Scopulibacillus cellulosilyticus]|uniref:Class I fructose-bisphosphate aldolase n=1 Tax=Scopulibacillus cellulosilyticus TaxID=2665665 RepID=A0ABW2Q735_9BACL
MSKTRRMSHIFASDGKSITLALDGFYFSTKTAGIDDTIAQLPKMIENGLDAVIVTYGMAKTYENALTQVGMIVRADMSTGIFDSNVPDTAGLITVEDALKLGADGVIAMTFPGAANEAASHQVARELAREADKWDMTLICETLPYGYTVTNKASNQPDVIAAGARLGTELGADIIKTRFSGESGDARIIRNAQRPVLALGGPKANHILDYFRFVEHCMDAGAKGVAVGRNVTENENPAGVVAGLNVIIHGNGSAEEAYEAFQS